VYTIGISYIDNQVELGFMKAIADSTGGEFLLVDHPDDIAATISSMMSIVSGGANDCTFDYLSDCPDGTRRELKVIAEACGLADTAVVHFYAPLDPNLPVYSVTFDSTYAYERGDMLVPISVHADIPGTIGRIDFKILERPPLTFKEIITTGYLAEQGTVTHQIYGDSLVVSVTGPLPVSGSQTLMKIRYGTPQVGKDTLFWYPAYYLDIKSDDCVHYDGETSKLLILKRPGLDIICGDSLHVVWDQSTGSYMNDLVTVGIAVQNNTALSAENTRVKIDIPPGMELVSGTSTVMLPQNPLPPGQSGLVQFTLRVLPTDSSRSYRICVEVQPDSGRITTCCKTVTVDRASTALEVACSMIDRIEWSDSLNAFVPPVFPVTVQIRNYSDLLAKDVPAWIHVPPGFAVDSATPVNTIISPSILGRSDTGFVTWMVRPLERPTSDLVKFCIKVAAGRDTAICCQDVFIEASPVRAQLSCGDTRVLVYDNGTGEYDPERMLIVTRVRNLAKLPMANTRGHIQLPSFLELDAGEYPSKDFPNSAVIQPGDSAEIKWVVVAKRPPTTPAAICVNITAENFPGSQCCTSLDVETVNAIPAMTCTLEAPDTIRYQSGSYTPNPFTLRVRVQNTGNTPALDVYAALLQGEDLSIDATDQALKLLTDSLAIGGSVEGTFRVRVLDRAVGRYDTIRVTVYAANGGGMVCEKIVYIEPVRGPVLELNCDGPDSLVFDDALNLYQPTPFTVQLEARNVGTAVADSVIAEILPSPDITLAVGEQAAKLLTPSTLPVNGSGVASWQLRAVPRSEDRIDTIRVQVRAKGKSLQQTEPCPIAVFIPAARQAALDLSCSVLKAAVSDDTVIVAAGLTNNGSATAYDVSVQIQFPSKLTLSPSSQTLTLTADSIRPGEALRVFPWRFVIERGAVLDSVDVCFNVTARFHSPLNCCTRVLIPPADQAGFTYDCQLEPDTVFVQQSSGEYQEALFRTSVTNPGTVPVDSIRCSILLPNGVSLAAGEAQQKTVYDLQPGSSEVVSWRINFLRDTATVYSERRIRVELFGAGTVRSCERSIVVAPPPLLPSDFVLSCSAPDTIVFKRTLNAYEPAPFLISTEIRNTGSTVLTNVRGTLTPASQITLESGETLTKPLGVDLGPGQSASIAWSCRGIPQQQTTTALSTIRVESDGDLFRQCAVVTVLYHPPSNDSADISIACIGPDTIRFTNGQWIPNPFTYTVRITNTGTVPLTQVRGLILSGAQFSLADGEQSTKSLPEPLQPGNTSTVSWVVNVLAPPPDGSGFFEVIVTSAETGEVKCSTTVVVESSYFIIQLRIPDNNVGVMGETIKVPVLLTNPQNILLRAATIAVSADPQYVRFEGVSLEGTLLKEWPAPVLDRPEDGVLRIQLGSEKIASGSGVFLYLNSTLLRQEGFAGDFEVRMMPLEFRPMYHVFETGVSAQTIDGAITTTGICIEPLFSDEYLQLNNRPNPFNPATTITYHVPPDLDGMYGTLEVRDMHGRLVARPVEGQLQAGTHELTFDGSSHPSGMYLYQLRVGSRMVTRKMLLSK
jgi:uncharacterized membrane protein